MLETERLILRPWNENDAESLYEYAKHPLVGPAAGWQVHTSVENSREIIKNILSKPETYAVVLKESGKPIGSVGIFPHKKRSIEIYHEAEVGYWIGFPFWGRGLIPEAVTALLDRCFYTLDCIGVWCGYYNENYKSKRVQDKCGFVHHHTDFDEIHPLTGKPCAVNYTYITKDRYISEKNK